MRRTLPLPPAPHLRRVLTSGVAVRTAPVRCAHEEDAMAAIAPATNRVVNPHVMQERQIQQVADGVWFQAGFELLIPQAEARVGIVKLSRIGLPGPVGGELPHPAP